MAPTNSTRYCVRGAREAQMHCLGNVLVGFGFFMLALRVVAGIYVRLYEVKR